MPAIRRLATTATILSAVLLALPASTQAATTEVTGAAILQHPIGKVAVQNMAFMAAGKIDEALKMSSKAMNAEFAAMSAEDRKMMTEMMKAFAVADAEFRASITKAGKLVIDGDTATLTIVEKQDDANAKSTSTMTQRYAMEDGKWKVSR